MQYIPELDVYVGAVTNTDRDYVAAPDLVERGANGRKAQ